MSSDPEGDRQKARLIGLLDSAPSNAPLRFWWRDDDATEPSPLSTASSICAGNTPSRSPWLSFLLKRRKAWPSASPASRGFQSSSMAGSMPGTARLA